MPNTVICAQIMVMTSDFRAAFELSLESVAENSKSYIRDEIFNILKMCHHSGDVVPCTDAQRSHRHTL